MTLKIPETLYPFESHFFDLADGLRYHYVDEGPRDAETMVMIHGNPTWSFYYRNLILAFRGEVRCLAPDHIGCGLSDKPGDDCYEYSLERRIDDLEAFLDHVAPEGKITLVVHDWGGMIGLGWASRHPERVGRLVIFNTGAFHKPDSKRFPLLLGLSRNPVVGPLCIRGLNAFSFAATHLCVKRKALTKEVRRAYRAPYDSWANRIATLRFVQDIPLRPGDRGYDIVTEVGNSIEQFRKVPALICWGLLDFVFDKHFLDEWTRRLPEAEVHRFEDAGHYILEDAGEEIVSILRGFLETNPVNA